ncbi:T9SS type B sorting domain-containing protein [Chryseobacterium sp. Y16C]|uniref:DUF7948 domain-containing protein n=1 Tax=Chryseobacterium sp. Y16C TaxID=2920939 RepID=UPI001F0A14FD|nr:T9SS type B sorting domain-containing protein [Chryseobacterium sp. Y16C]UMQ42806.1 T9SS type B sorting domain-containing protein [Chryseobacterium sp. Y16C]
MMKKILFIFSIISCAFLSGQKNLQKNNEYYFYENKGQILNQDGKENKNVQYLFLSNGLNVQLKKNGFSYDVYQVEEVAQNNPAKLKLATPESEKKFKYKFHRVDIELLHSNNNSEIIAEGKSPDYENFYTIPDKPEGVLNVHRYKKVTYKNIYNNIDLVFFKPQDTLKPIEYNFIIRPGGRVSDIKLKFNGIKTHLKDDKIVMNLRFGEMQENIPQSWIINASSKIETEIKFRQIEDNTYGFIGSKDNYDKVLIIDPVPTPLWIKNLPNWVYQSNSYYRVFANNNQEVYTSFTTIAKYNFATDTYTIMDSYSQNYGYVSKFDPSGNKIWGVFIGNHHYNYNGDSTNMLKDIVVNSNNEIYAIGHARDTTNGTNTITTPGAHKTNSSFVSQYYPMDNTDGFIMKFNDNGIRIWGTYFGGNNGDSINSIVLDSNENLILAGLALGNDGIATPNAEIPTNSNILNGTSFIAKFSASGQQLYGSYFNLREGIKKIDRDTSGNIYLTGDVYRNYNTSGPGTTGTHQQNIIGEGNTYLGKLNSNFQFQWGTYYGGRNWYGILHNMNEGFSRVSDLKIDQDGNIILLGNTNAQEKIATSGTHQPAYTGQTGNDIYLTKFNPNGTQIWGTYFGATTNINVDDDVSYCISIDDNNNILFGGRTSNNINIATTNAFLPTNNGGYYSGFFTKFNTTGNQTWGTYYYLTINSIYARANNIYILGGAQINNNFAKFYDCAAGISATSNSPVCINSNIQLNASGGTMYSWTGPNGFTSNQQNPIIPNASIANTGTYTCQITGSGACDGTFSVNVVVGDSIPPIPNTTTLPDITGDCHTTISTIPTATDNCVGTINATTTDPLSYSLPGTYIIHWIYNDGNGNTTTQNQTVIVTAPAPPTTINTQQIFCKTNNPKISDLQITGQNIKWYDAAGNILTPTTALVNGQTYYASQTINGCESNKVSIQVTINETPKPSGNTAQDFCSSAAPKLTNLIVSGTALQFYDAAGNILPLTTPLVHGTTYFVTQTLNNCESEKLAISVTLSNNNVPANAYSVTLCNTTIGNSMVADLTSYQGNIIANPAAYIFTYTDTAGNVISNPLNYVLNIGQNAVFVKVSTPDGCFKIVRLSITLNPKPGLNLPEKIDFCKGKSIVLDAGSGYTSYVWNTGATTQTITVSTPGNYSVTVTNNFGCQDTDNTLVSYTILPEIVSVNISNNTATVILSATGNFEYSLDNSSWQDSNIFSNLNMGEYIVYVRTKEGCVIGQKSFSIFNIPNTFTPDGDGYNDKWKIAGLDNYSGSEVSVYDRKGLLVFKETITKKPLIWDGKQNGNQLPTGTYWYIIKVSDGRIYNGWVLIKNRE